MAGCAAKVYIAYCPNCRALLKEISPVPLHRCQGCKKFLLVKTWKLEEVAVNNDNVSAGKQTSNQKSETLGFISDGESISKCNEKPMFPVDANGINIYKEKNGESNAVEGHASGKPDGFGTQKSASEPTNSDAMSSDNSSTFQHGSATTQMVYDRNAHAPAPAKDWEEGDNGSTVQINSISTRRGVSETGSNHHEPTYDGTTLDTNEIHASPADAVTIEMGIEGGNVNWEGEEDLLSKIDNLSLQRHASENKSPLGEDIQSERMMYLKDLESPHVKDANAFVGSWKDEEESVIRLKFDSVSSQMSTSENRLDICEANISYVKDEDNAGTICNTGGSDKVIVNSCSFSSQSSMSENVSDFCGLIQSEGEISLREAHVLCPAYADVISTGNEKNEVERWPIVTEGVTPSNCTSEDELEKHAPTLIYNHVSKHTAPCHAGAVASGVDDKKISRNSEDMSFYSRTERYKFGAGYIDQELEKQAETPGFLTEASLSYNNDCIAVQKDGTGEYLCQESSKISHAYEWSISSAHADCLPLHIRNVKPVSRRTFRSRKVFCSNDISVDMEEEIVTGNKNENAFFEAADPELNFTSPASSESSSICWTTESIFSPCNHETSPSRQAPTSHSVEKEESKSFLINKNENVGSETVNKELHVVSSSSSESSGLCWTTESVPSPRNHESSPSKQVTTLHPVDVEESKSFVVNKNETVVSDTTDEELHFSLPSLSQAIGSCSSMDHTILSPSNYESPIAKQITLSHLADKEEHTSVLANKINITVCNAAEEQNFTSPTLSESSGLYLTAESLHSLSNHGSLIEQTQTSDPIDMEQNKSFSMSKNDNAVSPAADQEQHYSSPLSSKSSGIYLNMESIILPAINYEISHSKQVSTSHLEDKECRSILVYKSEDVVSQGAEKEQQCTSSSPKYTGLCSATESAFFPSNLESSPPKKVLTSHPADKVGESATVKKNEIMVSEVEVQEQHSIFPPSSSESSVLRRSIETVVSLRNCESSPVNQVLTSHAEEEPINVSSIFSSSENGAGPENDCASIFKPPDSASQQVDNSSTRRKSVNPNHLELIKKIDELKVEITKSIAQRKKGNKPRRTGKDAQTAEKPVVRNGRSEQDCRLLLQTPALERPKHHSKYRQEHNKDICQPSPSSSNTSSSPSEAICSASGSVTMGAHCSTYSSTAAKTSHTVSNTPHRYHGNHKVARMRRLQKRDINPLMKRHCRPLLGSAPFIVCYECLGLLQMPEDFQFSRENKKLQCGACFKVLTLALLNQTHVVPSSYARPKSS